MSAVAPEWIAVDWGTTRLRAYAMQGGEQIDQRTSDDGMAALSGKDFSQALERLIAPWRADKQPVIASGMVGARGGWQEADYIPVPCDLSDLAAHVVSPEPNIWIVPGLSQNSPADVMRGEETQLLGLARMHPGFSGSVCLPGTHSKWVTLEGTTVTGFSTAMTGEMFDLLSNRSILRLTIGDQDCEKGFARGVEMALDAPAMLIAHLFSLRAEALLSGGDENERRGRLSGLLIGAEVANFAKGETMLVGASELCTHYARAIEIAGFTSQQLEAKTATIAGLSAIREDL